MITYRLQIDDLLLSIPREFLRGFTCIDETLERRCTIDNKKFCQRDTDEAPIVSLIHFQIGKVPAYDAKCDERIYVSLRTTAKPQIAESQETLQKRLTDECVSRPYFHTCQHNLTYGQNLAMHITYDFKCRPPEKISETLELIRNTLDQYKSKSK